MPSIKIKDSWRQLTVKEAALLKGVHEVTIRRWYLGGDIFYEKLPVKGVRVYADSTGQLVPGRRAKNPL